MYNKYLKKVNQWFNTANLYKIKTIEKVNIAKEIQNNENIKNQIEDLY